MAERNSLQNQEAPTRPVLLLPNYILRVPSALWHQKELMIDVKFKKITMGIMIDGWFYDFMVVVGNRTVCPYFNLVACYLFVACLLTLVLNFSRRCGKEGTIGSFIKRNEFEGPNQDHYYRYWIECRASERRRRSRSVVLDCYWYWLRHCYYA